jgi:membrane protein YdbS with pleckstrin-like domain
MTADIPATGGTPDIIRPSSRLRVLYNVYLLVVVWCLVVPGLLILIAFLDPVTRIAISVVVLVLALVAITMIRRSCDSLVYVLDENTLEVRRGPGKGRWVSIPYARISSVVITRRRLPSYFGIASVRIAYKTGSGERVRVDLNGIEDPESLRSLILRHTGERPG